MELAGKVAKCLTLLFLVGEFCVTFIYMIIHCVECKFILGAMFPLKKFFF